MISTGRAGGVSRRPVSCCGLGNVMKTTTEPWQEWASFAVLAGSALFPIKQNLH